MKPEQMAQALESVAKQVGVTVRYEALPPGGTLNGGGLCRVRGAWVLFIDRKASAGERVQLLTDVLSGFDTGAVPMPARVREALAARSRGAAARMAASAAPAL